MGRRFAIGDIHGCLKTFRSLVEDVIQLERDDTLYLLGDYIDRGPDAAGVLDTIIGLQEAGWLVYPILGNHERMLLDSLRSTQAESLWLLNGGAATLESFGVDTPRDIPRRYLEFIGSLPLCRVIDDYAFVHAGLDFGKKYPLSESSETTMLWGRECLATPDLIGGRTLVVGHTVTGMESIEASLSTGCIRIDNGCYQGVRLSLGALVALNLDTRKIVRRLNCEEFC